MRNRSCPIVLLAGLGALIFQCGCNVAMTMPELRYQTPEVRSKAGHGHALLIAQQATELIIVPSTLVRPPITDAPKFASELRDIPAFTAALSATRRLEFSVRATDDAPFVVDAKYQIVGACSSAAREDRFSCALLVGGGGGHNTEKEELSDLTVESEVSNSTAEAGVLVGRRFGSVLPYAGAYYAGYWADGTVDQNGERFPFDGSGSQVSLNFGVTATVWHVEARSEMSWSSSDWESEETENTAFGVGLGGSW